MEEVQVGIGNDWDGFGVDDVPESRCERRMEDFLWVLIRTCDSGGECTNGKSGQTMIFQTTGAGDLQEAAAALLQHR